MPDDVHEILRHPAFAQELLTLRREAPREYAAVSHATSVLIIEGARLGHPWSSSVRGTLIRGLRELRPRRGRSRLRVLYRRSRAGFELLALAPEAQSDRRGFASAVATAARRAEETNRGLTT